MDKQLSALWTDMKKQLKKDADPESAKLIDQLSYEDLVGPNSGNFFRQLAEAQLGPILAAMGIDEDPFDFFVEVIKLATFLQFVTCGMLFYGTELWAHLDTGEGNVWTLIGMIHAAANEGCGLRHLHLYLGLTMEEDQRLHCAKLRMRWVLTAACFATAALCCAPGNMSTRHSPSCIHASQSCSYVPAHAGKLSIARIHCILSHATMWRIMAFGTATGPQVMRSGAQRVWPSAT